MARLEYQNGIAGIKNLKNQYIDATPAFAQLHRYDSSANILGITDHALAEYALNSTQHPGHLVADDFIIEDEQVFRGNHLFIFETLLIHEQLFCALLHKMPYKPHNKIEGCIFHTLIIPHANKTIVQSYLNNPDIRVSEHTKKYLDIHHLSPSSTYSLSPRELDCIQYLVKGASAYDIALKLGLSKRTVEFYIRNIKDKLGVSKMTEVVAKVIADNLVPLL